MNKRTKGAIAAGGAAALLLTGAGSLAYWNDSAQIDGGSIGSGELAITAEAGQWFDLSANPGPGGSGTPIDSPSDFLIVPGDVLEYRASATVHAKGEHLNATLTANTQTVSGDQALLGALQVSVNATGVGTGGATITEDDDGETFDVVVRITFNPATSGTVGQNQTVNLDNLTLNLQQTPRA